MFVHIYYGQTYEWQAIEHNKDRTIKKVNYTYLSKAIEIYSKGISIDSTNPSLYSKRAYCYNVIGDSINAVNDMFKAATHGDKLMQNLLKRRYPEKASW